MCTSSGGNLAHGGVFYYRFPSPELIPDHHSDVFPHCVSVYRPFVSFSSHFVIEHIKFHLRHEPQKLLPSRWFLLIR